MHMKAKLEVKKVTGKATSEEWVQLGDELEKDVLGSHQRSWGRVPMNETRRMKVWHMHL